MIEFISYNPKTGLSIDYRWAWAEVSTAHRKFHIEKSMPEDEFHKIISNPIPLYLQYIEKNHSAQGAEATLNVKSRQDLARLDEIVAEYNVLPLSKKKKQDAHLPYWRRCADIIMGEATQEQKTSQNGSNSEVKAETKHT
jgi:hypothetical protein